LRRQIIRSKRFLERIYIDWYDSITQELKPGRTLELGSGAGFFGEFYPQAVTSDLFIVEGLQTVLDGQSLPFKSGSLANVTMVNVLHHIPDSERLFREAARCVQMGGRFVMIEPWITPWSRFIYTRLHHEPLDENAKDWKISGTGPLSAANSALPWIIFERDRDKFKQTFPEWRIVKVEPFMPLRYLISGGISLRSLMPAFTYGFWRAVENTLQPLAPKFAMFAKIVLTRN
jgi:SAM-dependent methyltransferase